METPVAMALDQELELFAKVSQVESVYVLRRGDVVRVFTVINHDSEEVLDEIAALELALGKRLRFIRFDFNTIARRNRPIQEFLNDCLPVWSRDSCQHLATT